MGAEIDVCLHSMHCQLANDIFYTWRTTASEPSRASAGLHTVVARRQGWRRAMNQAPSQCVVWNQSALPVVADAAEFSSSSRFAGWTIPVFWDFHAHTTVYHQLHVCCPFNREKCINTMSSLNKVVVQELEHLEVDCSINARKIEAKHQS